MKYQPLTCVWEVTMGCNMRCGHCGSSCAEPLPNELNTMEALELCNQIADLGLKWITLSGGEPLTRKDIPLLIRRLSEKGVSVNMITNGWLLNRSMVEQLKQSGIATVAISIDGTKEIHDNIRKEGAFEHAETSFGLMKEMGIRTGAVTTITNQNIHILDELKEELIRMGVDSWQVQLGLPMGNLKEKPDWLIQPEKVKDIIDFCYDTAKEGRIKIYPADCIGYYTKKEMEIKKISYETDMVSIWDGCNAGIRGFGILHNGDILGCTSIRDKSYIEGNVRERLLRDIWEDKDAFSWRRGMEKKDQKGECNYCKYGSKCLGGCPNTRLTMNGDIHSENTYCAYNLQLKRMREKYGNMENAQELFSIGDSMIKQGFYQEAAIALEQLHKLEPQNKKALIAKAYAEYMCGNYEICKNDNKKAVELDPDDSDALGGYASALFRLGEQEEAIKIMKKAASMPGCREELKKDLYQMELKKYFREGTNMDTIKFFKLQNNGGFVVRMQVLWSATDAKGDKYSGKYEPSDYHDICASGERTIDLSENTNIPDGAEVQLKASVQLGKDKTASEKYIYHKDASQLATYEISGTTLINTLSLKSYK